MKVILRKQLIDQLQYHRKEDGSDARLSGDAAEELEPREAARRSKQLK